MRPRSRHVRGQMALFTVNNAAEMQARGVAAKLARKEKTIVATLTPEVEATNADNYRKLRLLRTRKQLDLIDELIFSELVESKHAGKLDKLASAAMRLNEQERQLSNRSLPPTLKADTRKPKTRSAAEPVQESGEATQ